MSAGYIILDTTWNRLVRFVDLQNEEPPTLWEAESSKVGGNRGPTLFPTKAAANRAIRLTRLRKNYAWSVNDYVVFKVQPCA